MEANDREMVLMREASNANNRITQTHKNITNMFTTYNLAIDEFKKRMNKEYICYKDPAKDLTIVQNQINKVNIHFQSSITFLKTLISISLQKKYIMPEFYGKIISYLKTISDPWVPSGESEAIEFIEKHCQLNGFSKND